jgi:hypothetical protein
MNRFLVWGPLVALFAIAGYVSAGESTDVKELLERMKKMESKMAEQEKTIKDLRAGGEVKATAAQQVDKALSNSSAGAIFHDTKLHNRPIKMGGYLDVTYQYAINQPTTGINNERVFDAFDNNDFNVHLAQIYFDATAQKKGQAGFRIDLAFGSDANSIEQLGPDNMLTSDDRFDGNGFTDPDAGSENDDDFTLLQAYIDYIIPVANGIRMKVGKFATPIGFEVIQAQDNWNATRSFQFGKALPFTHTGIGFEYKVFSNWEVRGYFVNGWDVMRDNNEGKTGIVQSIWSPTEWITWTVSGAVGNEIARGRSSYAIPPDADDRADEDTTYLANTVLTFNPWEKWNFAIEASYGLTENGSNNDAEDGLPGAAGYNDQNYRTTPDAKWWAVAGYLKYQFLPEWYLAARGEYFNDHDATRTWYGVGYGGRQELYSGTATLAYSPVSPFEIRLEYRYDASSREAFAVQDLSDEVSPHDGNPADFRGHQDTVTVQFLYKF